MFINHTAVHLYHIVLNVLSNVNEDFLRSCVQDDAVPVDSHQLRLTKINHLKGLFDQNMSYYPSVWFMRLFIECLTFSSSLVRRSMTWDVLVTLHAFSTLTDILTVACIILHVDYADRCATELYNQLTQKLDGSESPEVRALVKEIGTTYKLNSTPYRRATRSAPAESTFSNTIGQDPHYSDSFKKAVPESLKGKPSIWSSVWQSFLDFNTAEEGKGIQFSLIQKGTEIQSGSLKLSRETKERQLRGTAVFLRKWDVWVLKSALYDDDNSEYRLLIDEPEKTLELLKTESGYRVVCKAFSRSVSLDIFTDEVVLVRRLLHSVNVVLNVRANFKQEELLTYQADLLAVMLLYYTKKQMAKNICIGCDENLPAQQAHSCSTATRIIEGIEVSVKFHEAALVVVGDLANHSTRYRKLLAILKIDEPPGIEHRNVVSALYSRAYPLLMKNENIVNSIIPPHAIDFLIEYYLKI
ncbi:hypothetical protein HDE_09510 [Halotydeus destructor]|nr:hypothetical protein HDE_09510 [Halotydeus destructor]